ncbi:MAG: esterase/lipase family protein [Candidatus Hodarchaeota archaeon]
MDFVKILRILNRNKVYGVFLLPLFLIRMFLAIPCSYTISYVGEGICAQGSYIYFVHGYYATNSYFDDMIKFLNDSGYFQADTDHRIMPAYFDYFDKYIKLNMTRKKVHFIEGGISTYANDFFELLSRTHNSPTELVIIAHSLGGIITREMLRNHHVQLEELGIQVIRVITLASPHLGTELATNPIIEAALNLMGSSWDTPVGRSLSPGSEFIRRLNENANSYMNHIDWYFVAGVSLDLVSLLGQEFIYNGIPCDGFVDWKSALAIGLNVEPAVRLVLPKDHYQLIHDPKNQESYQYICKWLSGNRCSLK